MKEEIKTTTNADGHETFVNTFEEKMLTKFESLVSGPTSFFSKIFPSLESRQLSKLKKESFKGQIDMLQTYHKQRKKEVEIALQARTKGLEAEAMKYKINLVQDFLAFADDKVFQLAHQLQEASLKASTLPEGKGKEKYLQTSEVAFESFVELIEVESKNFQNNLNK